MKKRTKEILSGVLAFSIVLSTPAGMAAAEAVGQQQGAVQTGDGGGTSEQSSENISEVLSEVISEEASANASQIFPEEISENESETMPGQTMEEASKDTMQISAEVMSEAFPEEILGEGSERESKALSDGTSEEASESEPESFTESIAEDSESTSEILTEETSGSISNEISEAASESMSEIYTESELKDLPDVLENESNIRSEKTSENMSEVSTESISDETTEDESDMESERETESLTESISEDSSNVSIDKSDIEPAETLEDKSDIESTETLESESDIRSEIESEDQSETLSDEVLENSSEIESEQTSDIESETESEQPSESISEIESEQPSESISEIESEMGLEDMSEDMSETDSEVVPEESPEMESSTKEDRTDNSDETIYTKEVDNNTASNTEECDIDVPVLKELWVESECHEAANTDSGRFLVKDFVLKGIFGGKVNKINKIEYTTDLRSENKSIWLEAKNTQTVGSEASVTEFQITLPDGTYPSIAVRAYDEAGNVSEVKKLVNDSGESIKVVVDSMSDSLSRFEVTNSEITKPEHPKQEIIEPEEIKSEVIPSAISKPEHPKQEIIEPELSKSEVIKPELPKPNVIGSEIVKSEILPQKISESVDIRSENSKTVTAKQEVTDAGLTQKTLLSSGDIKLKLQPSELQNTEAIVNEQMKTFIIDNLVVNEIADNSKALSVNTLLADGTRPEINISFNDNATANKNIYRQKRTATIHVHESDFDPDTVNVSITKDNKPSEVLLSDWTSEGNEHYATFELSEEGEYNIAASCIGLADQTETFIIDRIAPKMTVDLVPARKAQISADAATNNAVQNDSFNTGVTAVIRVTEHNFREEDFAINMTSASGTWIHDGDVHTLRIPFDEDDVYHIECAYTDLHGNSVKAIKKDFLIDTAAPTITIEGVGNNSANNSVIRPVISVADSNMELSDISVSVMTGTGELVQSAIDTELVSSEDGTGYRLTLTDITEQPDNVYHLLVSACDKAGNVAERSYRFSLNRNGSVYDLTSLKQLVDQKYSTYNALNDIQVVEMNMDSVEEFDLYISRNGALGYKAEYTKETSGSEDAGYTYSYQIKKENFAEEGIYRLTMYSKDRAGNEVNNATDINGDEITFVVDNTAPKVVIDGVESGMVYEAKEQVVHVVVMDNLKLDEAELFLVNEANEVLERWDYIALAGEDGALDITIPQHSEKLSLLYRVKDASGNESQTFRGDAAAPTDFIVNTNKTREVSSNFWIGFVTGIPVLIMTSLSAIILKKRHKRK